MSAGVIEVGHVILEAPDFRGAFTRAKDWFGGNLPEAQKVWGVSDYFTPVWHFADKFII